MFASDWDEAYKTSSSSRSSTNEPEPLAYRHQSVLQVVMPGHLHPTSTLGKPKVELFEAALLDFLASQKHLIDTLGITVEFKGETFGE